MCVIKYILSIVIAASTLSCYGQQKTNYKCAYQFDILRDTIAKEYFRKEVYIVQIGEKMTKGFTYQKFYLDSLREHSPDLYRKLFTNSVRESIEAMRRTGEMSHVRNNAFTNGAFPSDLYKDYTKNEIRVRDNVASQEFVYKDELKPQEWEILDDTTTILGYHCQKAKCHFKGRDYEAWFTTEIPISEGPWKFYGLPGLITKLYDTKKHYTFELIGFQKTEEPIDTKTPADSRKIERKEFLRMKFGEKGETIKKMEAAKVGLSVDSGSKSTKHYDYIELDYKE